jgi:O-antigen/teichoic acid export membrane protein
MGIVGNTLSGLLTYGLVYLLALANSILVSRVLGPELRGTFFLISATVDMAVILFSFGIGNANTVFLGRRQFTLTQMNSLSIISALGLGGAAIGLYWAARGALQASLIPHLDPSLVLLGLVQVPFLLYEGYWSSLMVGRNEITHLNKFQVTKNIAQCLLNALILLTTPWGVPGLLAGWMAVNLGGAALMLSAIHHREPLRISLTPEIIRQALAFGLKNHQGGIATYVWQRFDSFILNAYHGPAAVGIYSLAVSVTEMFWKLVSPLVNALYPRITGSSPPQALELTAKATRHVAFATSLGAILMAGIAPTLVPLLYGQAFQPSVAPLRILLVGTVAICIGMIIAIHFVGQLDRPGLLAALAWLNAAVNIVLSLLLIPTFGAMGAAWGSTLTYGSGIVVVIMIFSRLTRARMRDLLVMWRSDFQDYHWIARRILGAWSKRGATLVP